MLAQHFVRVGLLGSVGRFAAADRRRYRRGARVVCRTSRGLEVGEVLSPADGPAIQRATARCSAASRSRTTCSSPASKKTATRPIRPAPCGWRSAARRRCWSTSSTSSTASRFTFISWGTADPSSTPLTAELAEAYEAKAQLQKFADTLTAGCGPNCGTEEGGGCGSGGCSTCAVGWCVRHEDKRTRRQGGKGIRDAKSFPLVSPSPCLLVPP